MKACKDCRWIAKGNNGGDDDFSFSTCKNPDVAPTGRIDPVNGAELTQTRVFCHDERSEQYDFGRKYHCGKNAKLWQRRSASRGRCEDCKHCEPYRDFMGNPDTGMYPWCRHPNAEPKGHASIWTMRHPMSPCDLEGKLWEPRA